MLSKKSIVLFLVGVFALSTVGQAGTEFLNIPEQELTSREHCIYNAEDLRAMSTADAFIDVGCFAEKRLALGKSYIGNEFTPIRIFIPKFTRTAHVLRGEIQVPDSENIKAIALNPLTLYDRATCEMTAIRLREVKIENGFFLWTCNDATLSGQLLFTPKND